MIPKFHRNCSKLRGLNLISKNTECMHFELSCPNQKIESLFYRSTIDTRFWWFMWFRVSFVLKLGMKSVWIQSTIERTQTTDCCVAFNSLSPSKSHSKFKLWRLPKFKFVHVTIESGSNDNLIICLFLVIQQLTTFVD